MSAAGRTPSTRATERTWPAPVVTRRSARWVGSASRGIADAQPRAAAISTSEMRSSARVVSGGAGAGRGCDGPVSARAPADGVAEGVAPAPVGGTDDGNEDDDEDDGDERASDDVSAAGWGTAGVRPRLHHKSIAAAHVRTNTTMSTRVDVPLDYLRLLRLENGSQVRCRRRRQHQIARRRRRLVPSLGIGADIEASQNGRPGYVSTTS